MTCPFCKLIAEQSDRLDYTTSEWATFRPVGPLNKDHALIIPVRHVERFESLEPLEAKEFATVLNYAILAYGALSYNLAVNAGEAAGQTVSHLHIHLIPREAGDIPGYHPEGGIVAALGARMPGSDMNDYLAALAAMERMA